VARTVLAGDIGGTKTNLALWEVTGPGRVVPVREASFPSAAYGGLEEVVGELLRGGGEGVAAAAFGIAGPVIDDAVATTNLPWRVEAASLRRLLGTPHVRLMNDLEATAYGALFLPAKSLHTLNPGRERAGNRAVIAAGTGLGQGFLFWDGMRHVPVATEGGHVDFAPRDEVEMALLRFLQKTYARVSYERLLSGPGLLNVFRFLAEGLGRPVAPAVRARLERADADPSAVVGEAGVAGTCPTCVEAVEFFVAVYGAQAGNLALTVMATGGVYVGGGIVTKMLPRMTTGAFMRAFVAKGRYEDFMAAIPVHIILEPKTALLGAAQAAAELGG
jgi:glucokinase